MARRQPDDRSQTGGGEAGFPTRDYIGAMCLEMARMARAEGEDRLAELLTQAAEAAGAPRG